VQPIQYVMEGKGLRMTIRASFFFFFHLQLKGTGGRTRCPERIVATR
jgi:hypothetical protein